MYRCQMKNISFCISSGILLALLYNKKPQKYAKLNICYTRRSTSNNIKKWWYYFPRYQYATCKYILFVAFEKFIRIQNLRFRTNKYLILSIEMYMVYTFHDRIYPEYLNSHKGYIIADKHFCDKPLS